MNHPILKVGTKLKSVFFASVIEITAIREETNQVDIIIHPSDGHAFEEKNWNLEHLKQGFQRSDYFFPENENSKISVY